MAGTMDPRGIRARNSQWIRPEFASGIRNSSASHSPQDFAKFERDTEAQPLTVSGVREVNLLASNSICV